MPNTSKPWLQRLFRQFRYPVTPQVLRSQRQHFGPTARIPDLFLRRDQVHLGLETLHLQRDAPPPKYHHDLLEAACKVGTLEERISYSFKDKMTCIEALKTTGNYSPLYYRGVVYKTNRNQRLALLGDRVLGLAMCELWYQTGHSPGDYSRMTLDMETRAALNTRARNRGLHRSIIFANEAEGPSSDQIAETFEAILAAVYIDSDYSMETVKNVIKRLGLDNHPFLKAQDEHSTKQDEGQKDREAFHIKVSEQKEPMRKASTKVFPPTADDSTSVTESLPQKEEAAPMSKKSSMEIQQQEANTYVDPQPTTKITEALPKNPKVSALEVHQKTSDSPSGSLNRKSARKLLKRSRAITKDIAKHDVQEKKRIAKTKSKKRNSPQIPASNSTSSKPPKKSEKSEAQTKQPQPIEPEIIESEMQLFMTNMVSEDSHEPPKSETPTATAPSTSKSSKKSPKLKDHDEQVQQDQQSADNVSPSPPLDALSAEPAQIKRSVGQRERARVSRQRARLLAELEAERAARASLAREKGL